MNSTIISSYRNVLREIRRASIYPRTERSKVVPSRFRSLAEQGVAQGGASSAIQAQLDNAFVFMKAQREYQELLKRYNPLHDMSPEEHRTATANRVGLSMPREADLTKDL